MTREQKIVSLLAQFKELGIDRQIDYDKFYLYSIITHSTAIEGSTVTEIENQLLFDEGISAKGRSITEQLMNLDLKAGCEQSIVFAKNHADISIEMLKKLSSIVMKNTGTTCKAKKSPNKLYGITPFVLFIPLHAKLENGSAAKTFDFKERLGNVKLKDIDAFAKEHRYTNWVTERTKTLKKVS